MYRLVHNRNNEDRMLETLSELIVELANQEQQERLQKQQHPQTHPPQTQRTKGDAEHAVKRIYAKYKQTQQHLNKLRQEHLLKESGQNTNFRVANEKSKEIISRNPSKPIFQRTQDIINQKEFRVLNARLQKEGGQEQAKALLTNRSSKQFNIKQFQQKHEKWEEKRKEFINTRKMQLLAQSYAQLQQKPALGDKTNKILNRNKDFYQRDVLERFNDYNKKSGGELAAKKNYFNKLITPFTPKLSDKTRLLANRSIKNLKNGESVFERISKSPSAKCVKHEKLHYLEMHKNHSPTNSAKRAANADLHNVTFSTPRSLAKSSSRVRLNQTSKGSFTPILKKLDLKFSRDDQDQLENTHRVTFSPVSGNEQNDRASTQRGNRQHLLKDVVYGNRDQVINFIKQLIIADRQQQQH